MRLVFVHGINNENYSRESIEATWFGALKAAWERLGLHQNSGFSVATVYYADVLAELFSGLNARRDSWRRKQS